MTDPDLPHMDGGMTGDEPEPTSPDSEFDELFAIPDVELTIGPISIEFKDETDGLGHQQLPFQTVHKPPLKFKALHRRVFIPNTAIRVKIVDHERSVTTHLLNPNLYTLQLTHGDFTWRVHKRYKHFQHLHQQLKLYRAKLTIPFPTKAHRERRTSFKMDLASDGKDIKSSGLPRFPNKPEALVPYEDIDKRIQQLEEYLNNLLLIKLYRNHHETVSFLEVSNLSFIHGLGTKGKEGPILKRTGSTHPGRAGCNFCGLLDNIICVRCSYLCSDVCGKWRNRWLFIKDTYLGYIRPRDGMVKYIMLFDAGFEVSSGLYATGLNHGLQIVNLSRQLVIKCWTRRKRKEWMAHLKEVASNQARDFTQKNRYNAFAPERESVQASWFVDGCSYMAAVADALQAAREEIFIADWWLSPEIHMKRPALSGDMWRLDSILKRKADEGVKVFVMLYKEVEMALGINSYYSKQRLCHDNIKVLRHPDHAKAGVFLWAHHEKIVVIDQSYAFLGGIDLCYGRWDDYQHRLSDLGSVSQTLGPFLPTRRKQTSSRPLGDTSHPQSLLHLAMATNLVGVGALGGSHSSLLGPEVEVPMAAISLPNLRPGEKLVLPQRTMSEQDDPDPPENVKCNTPGTERRNIMDKMREKADNARNVGRDFVHWLYKVTDEDEPKADANANVSTLTGDVEKVVRPSKTGKSVHYAGDEKGNGHIPSIMATSEAVTEEEPSGGDSYHTSLHSSMVDGLSGMAKFWIGKDYTNFIVKDFENLDSPYQDLVDRSTTPRMPWHDVGVLVQGVAARDVSRHFIQRWNAIKLEKAKVSGMYPYLMPKTYENLDKTFPPLVTAPLHRVKCQVVRSLGQWSAGFLDAETWEESIHEAYLDAISNAKHYVYLENQFFITMALQNGPVRNQIGETLFKRIVRAHKEGTVFRVFVVMPLLPGFEGEVGSPTGTALHAITHWNYSSINRGKDALLNRLKEVGIADPSEYVSFCGLRTHSALDGELVSELIYVHSKLLIVDDNLVICGSANINDRSLLGKRDSEIAVVLKDSVFEEGIMNTKPYQRGQFAGSLRRYLFREHLGLLEARTPNDLDMVLDPVSEHFYRNVWMKTATENTRLYEEVFHCIPTDQATSFFKLKKFQEEVCLCMSDPGAGIKSLEGVQGHLVNLPLDFLKNEVLTPNSGTVQGILPTSLWT